MVCCVIKVVFGLAALKLNYCNRIAGFWSILTIKTLDQSLNRYLCGVSLLFTDQIAWDTNLKNVVRSKEKLWQVKVDSILIR
jgi:hypothetical protein